MSKTTDQKKYEESTHYGGEAVVRFYPAAHYYAVTDPAKGFKNQRMGGATSLTGVMAKGQGLMLYPMYEMRKYLKKYFRSTTIEEMFDSPMSLDDLLKEATQAHVRKSDRGKNVGTNAHEWVESTLRRMIEWQGMSTEQQDKSPFEFPEIPEVEEIAVMLRRSYLAIFNAAKPTSVEEYRNLPKLIFQDMEVQEALWIEATMLHKSTTAAKEWFLRHPGLIVHGTEDTVYSRELMICGKYDADLEVTCTEKCGWCYQNGDANQTPQDFTGRYITDFKSTNASTEAPKGVYPEYLAQCGVYDLAKTEEHPELKYDGHLILNGSKNDGSFNTHFSFERDRNVAWARTLAEVKEYMYQAGKEVKASA